MTQRTNIKKKNVSTNHRMRPRRTTKQFAFLHKHVDFFTHFERPSTHFRRHVCTVIRRIPRSRNVDNLLRILLFCLGGSGYRRVVVSGAAVVPLTSCSKPNSTRRTTSDRGSNRHRWCWFVCGTPVLDWRGVTKLFNGASSLFRVSDARWMFVWKSNTYIFYWCMHSY